MDSYQKRWFLFSVISLGGCATVPTVQYHPVRAAGDMSGQADAFYRQASELNISISEVAAEVDNNGKAKKAVKQEIQVLSKPIPYEKDGKVGIKPITSWRSSTTVTLNKIENTDMIKSADVSVTDNTVKTINEYGGALVAIIALAGDALPGGGSKACITPDAPVSVTLPEDLSKSLDLAGSDKTTKCIKVEFGALPPDSIPVATAPIDVDTHNFYYSICREATITITHFGKPYVKTVRIADPKYLGYVQFPVKGSISTHSECGVSVKAESSVAGDSAAVVAEAFAKQAKAIKDALGK